MKRIIFTKGPLKGQIRDKEDQFADAAISGGCAELYKAPAKKAEVKKEEKADDTQTKELKPESVITKKK